jgi:hypothetical protein
MEDNKNSFTPKLQEFAKVVNPTKILKQLNIDYWLTPNQQTIILSDKNLGISLNKDMKWDAFEYEGHESKNIGDITDLLSNHFEKSKEIITKDISRINVFDIKENDIEKSIDKCIKANELLSTRYNSKIISFENVNERPAGFDNISLDNIKKIRIEYTSFNGTSKEYSGTAVLDKPFLDKGKNELKMKTYPTGKIFLDEPYEFKNYKDQVVTVDSLNLNPKAGNYLLHSNNKDKLVITNDLKTYSAEIGKKTADVIYTNNINNSFSIKLFIEKNKEKYASVDFIKNNATAGQEKFKKVIQDISKTLSKSKSIDNGIGD